MATVGGMGVGPSWLTRHGPPRLGLGVPDAPSKLRRVPRVGVIERRQPRPLGPPDYHSPDEHRDRGRDGDREAEREGDRGGGRDDRRGEAVEA
eukprot:2744216-Prymnesium_polylepis.2